jgi:hypothetical protein
MIGRDKIKNCISLGRYQAPIKQLFPPFGITKLLMNKGYVQKTLSQAECITWSALYQIGPSPIYFANDQLARTINKYIGRILINRCTTIMNQFTLL